jgi:hypothetical protein
MDEAVRRAQARWPNVPDVYEWLALDRRGRWLLRNPARQAFEPIGNAALRDFIGRNYACDSRGCWYFQNGPQRVFVRLSYTPFVVRTQGGGFIDHCGRSFLARSALLDDEGCLLLLADRVALLDDRDLAGYVDRYPDVVDTLPRIRRGEVPVRFGFVPDPSP